MHDDGRSQGEFLPAVRGKTVLKIAGVSDVKRCGGKDALLSKHMSGGVDAYCDLASESFRRLSYLENSSVLWTSILD